MYRKLRFTLRFLLGNLHDFDPNLHSIPLAELPATDRFMLTRFADVLDEVASAYDAFQFVRVYSVGAFRLIQIHLPLHAVDMPSWSW